MTNLLNEFKHKLQAEIIASDTVSDLTEYNILDLVDNSGGLVGFNYTKKLDGFDNVRVLSTSITYGVDDYAEEIHLTLPLLVNVPNALKMIHQMLTDPIQSLTQDQILGLYKTSNTLTKLVVDNFDIESGYDARANLIPVGDLTSLSLDDTEATTSQLTTSWVVNVLK